jgi:hypothetical protein
MLSTAEILRRDAELTEFKQYVLDCPDSTVEKLIYVFFGYDNTHRHFENLVNIANYARRYPHRVFS